MVKHPACAAAISSSGLVPFSFSKRVLKEYGVAASTPESVERLPLPSRPVPLHTAFALRIMLYPDSMRTREKCLAFGGGSDSDGRMIRGGFLIEEDPKALMALARAGLAAGRVTRRANALVLLDKGMSCQQVAEVLLFDDD